MPYINEVARKNLYPFLDDLVDFLESPWTVTTVGDLTFIFYSLAKAFVTGRVTREGQVSYQNYADLIAALENTKLETYRRQIAHYEDLKITENGDV
jgi:hypothetical protein